ncbi:MAG: 3-oxoacyl-[acyl-carrier-protein] synthase III C-terminal domain-containing protein [Fibrobacterota bacterium]
MLSKNSAGLELGDIETAYLPKYRDHVRFTYRNGRLHNHLHPKLAGIIGREVGPMIETALAGAGLSAEDVPHWALHPGGAKVLDELRDALDLSEEQMGWSRKILREHGNMSSPSVLFELKEIFDTKPAPGTPVMISAYGAGLSAFAVPGVFRGPAPR